MSKEKIINQKHLVEVNLFKDIIKVKPTINLWKPEHIVVCFSGGDDSLTTLAVALKYFKVTEVINWDTKTGTPENINFCKSICKKLGVKFTIWSNPNEKESYEAFVKEHGFPSSPQHNRIRIILKERALNEYFRQRKGKILLLSGVRKAESVKRKISVTESLVFGSNPNKPPKNFMNSRYCRFAPIANWSKKDCLDYLNLQGLERSEASKKLHRSGECNCGANADPMELQWLKIFSPKTYNWIMVLQKLTIKKFGKDDHRAYWGNTINNKNIKSNIEMKKHKTLDLFNVCQNCQMGEKSI